MCPHCGLANLSIGYWEKLSGCFLFTCLPQWAPGSSNKQRLVISVERLFACVCIWLSHFPWRLTDVRTHTHTHTDTLTYVMMWVTFSIWQLALRTKSKQAYVNSHSLELTQLKDSCSVLLLPCCTRRIIIKRVMINARLSPIAAEHSCIHQQQ